MTAAARWGRWRRGDVGTWGRGHGDGATGSERDGDGVAFVGRRDARSSHVSRVFL